MRGTLITLFLFVVVAVAKQVDVDKANNPLKEVDISKVINPAEDADVGKVIDPAKEVDTSEATNPMLNNNQPHVYVNPTFKKFVTHCSSHVVDTCSSETKPLHHEGGGIIHQSELDLCLFNSMEKCLVEHGASLYQTTSTSQQGTQLDQTPIPIPIPIPNIFLAKPPKEIIFQKRPSLPQQPRPQEIFRIKPHPQPRTKTKSFLFTSKDNHYDSNIPSETLKAIQSQSSLIETLKFQSVLKTCTHVTAQTCYTGLNVAKSDLAACLTPSINQCIYPDPITLGN